MALWSSDCYATAWRQFCTFTVSAIHQIQQCHKTRHRILPPCFGYERQCSLYVPAAPLMLRLAGRYPQQQTTCSAAHPPTSSALSDTGSAECSAPAVMGKEWLNHFFFGMTISKYLVRECAVWWCSVVYLTFMVSRSGLSWLTTCPRSCSSRPACVTVKLMRVVWACSSGGKSGLASFVCRRSQNLLLYSQSLSPSLINL